MKEEKRNCKIVQDLLPNYIEHLTNEETNQFIEEHLSNCSNCKEILENMKKEPIFNDKQNIEHKKVKYFKKYNRKLRVFQISSIILLLIILGISIYYWKYYRDGYFSAANTLIDVVSTYPDVFYATIEEIEDEDSKGDLEAEKTLKVKGLELNDERYKGEFYVRVPLNDEDNFKVEKSGNIIGANSLKTNQKIAIYVYDDGDSFDDYLWNARKIVLLEE